MHLYARVHVCMCICVYTCIYVCVCACVHTCVYICMQTYIGVCMCLCVHEYACYDYQYMTHEVTVCYLLTACDRPLSILAINILDMAVMVYCFKLNTLRCCCCCCMLSGEARVVWLPKCSLIKSINKVKYLKENQDFSINLVAWYTNYFTHL